MIRRRSKEVNKVLYFLPDCAGGITIKYEC